MSTTLRIAEVAQRSGFTPATLRYYEDIGLLTPPGRTEAGYRLYDETSLARLRFIARAKQLGCSLDEIADLASVWDGGRCVTVQQHLRTTVDKKITEAHAQIAALITLAAELEHAAAALSAEPLDGPCDDTCACTTASSASGTTAAPAPVAVPLVAKPDDPTGDAAGSHPVTRSSEPAGEAPIACTLDVGELSTRLDQWTALLADKQDLLGGVTARRALDDGLRLEFGPDADVAELARLAAAEQGCCRFFAFTLTLDARGIALEVRAPADAQPVLAALFGVAD